MGMDTLASDDPMETPPQAPLAGLDAADLLRLGAADGQAGSFHPPTIEELAPLFPRFEILELIGQGGMGAVYKVRQKDLDRVVALKILPPAISGTTGFSERFTQEAKALAKLNHPGIVTIHEFGSASSSQPLTPSSQPLYFILMEFVDGVNLGQLMRGGRIAPREALAIVPQICDALQFAHDRGIVHRDIKPENILLDRHGRVKVADFGIAKVVAAVCDSSVASVCDRRSSDPNQRRSQTDATIPGKVMGTPQYMAPEQMASPSEVDHRADIYALGVVFYQMLTGELPGKDLQAPSKKVRIDVRLAEIVMQALEKKPEMRFQQASVFKTKIEDVGETEKPEEVSKMSNAAKILIGSVVLLLPSLFDFISPSIAGPLRGIGIAIMGIWFLWRCILVPYHNAVARGMVRRWWRVLVITGVMGPLFGLAAGYGWYSTIPKKYESVATLLVQNRDGSETKDADFGRLFEVIKSRENLATVSRQLDLPKLWKVHPQRTVLILNRLVSVKSNRGEDLIRVSTRYTDPRIAMNLTNGVVDNLIKSAPVKLMIVETATIQQVVVSPSMALLLVIGAVAGLLVSLILGLALMALFRKFFTQVEVRDSGSGVSKWSTRKKVVGIAMILGLSIALALYPWAKHPVQRAVTQVNSVAESNSAETFVKLDLALAKAREMYLERNVERVKVEGQWLLGPMNMSLRFEPLWSFDGIGLPGIRSLHSQAG